MEEASVSNLIRKAHGTGEFPNSATDGLAVTAL